MKHYNFPFNHVISRLRLLKQKLYHQRFTAVKNNILRLKKHAEDIKSNNSSSSNLMANKDIQKEEKSFKEETIEFIKSMLSAMVLALLIRTFLLQPFNIPSESMLPNLYVGDYLFVSKYSYGYSNYSFPFAPDLFEGRIWGAEPERGDVVVFRVEDDGNKDYIKRLVGLPGDKISFRYGNLIINDTTVLIGKKGQFGTDTINPETIGADILTEMIDDKRYDVLDVFETPFDNTGDYIVPEGHYFFAGDNRDNSQDSRFTSGPVGFVHKDKLIGKAQFIFFSIRDASFFEFWKWPDHIRFNRIFKKIN